MLRRLTNLLLLVGSVTPTLAAMPARAAEVTLTIPADAPKVPIFGAITPWQTGGAVVTLRDAVASDAKVIYILINSPGGYVDVSDEIIKLIEEAKKKGKATVCVGGKLLASAAFNIYTHCTHRKAFKDSMMLFHPIRALIEGALTARDAMSLADELEFMDKKILAHMCRTMVEQGPAACVPLASSYYIERMWNATELAKVTKKGWIRFIDKIVLEEDTEEKE